MMMTMLMIISPKTQKPASLSDMTTEKLNWVSKDFWSKSSLPELNFNMEIYTLKRKFMESMVRWKGSGWVLSKWKMLILPCTKLRHSLITFNLVFMSILAWKIKRVQSFLRIKNTTIWKIPKTSVKITFCKFHIRTQINSISIWK